MHTSQGLVDFSGAQFKITTLKSSLEVVLTNLIHIILV
jgi:hypothetical protein